MADQSYVYQGFSRAEVAWGIFWITLGALTSLLLEVVYLDTRIDGFPVPYTIVVAFLFNRVLTKTSLLWSRTPAIALIPIFVWIAGFVVLTMTPGITGDQIVGQNLRAILLLGAGVAGGSWPLLSRR